MKTLLALLVLILGISEVQAQRCHNNRGRRSREVVVLVPAVYPVYRPVYSSYNGYGCGGYGYDSRGYRSPYYGRNPYYRPSYYNGYTNYGYNSRYRSRRY